MDKCKWCHTRLRVAKPILLWNSPILADSRIPRLTEGGQIAGREVQYICSSLALLGMLLLSSSYETIRVRPRLPASYQRLSIYPFRKDTFRHVIRRVHNSGPRIEIFSIGSLHTATKRKKETESIKALLIRSVPFRIRPFLSRFDSAILYTMYTMYTVYVQYVQYFVISNKKVCALIKQVSRARSLSLFSRSWGRLGGAVDLLNCNSGWLTRANLKHLLLEF